MKPLGTIQAFSVLDASELSAALKTIDRRFYVYVLFRPNGQPFYVGKGIGRRVFNHETEAKNTSIRTHKLNVIRAITRQGGQIGYALPLACDDKNEAHTFEIKLISEIGRHDLRLGPLTNQTDGGEGVTGLSAETMAKKAANLGGASTDPERRVANEFFHGIAGKQDSVPIKPDGLRRLEATVPHSNPRQPTSRMAKALVAGALASEQLLMNGLSIPRCFKIQGKAYVIENGVAKDMLKAGMITVTPAEQPELENFNLTALGFQAILELLSRERLEDLGVLEPIDPE
jgi:hypothetical protein